ncbi:MAG: DeoR/GlpR transcriptional regulator [Verrucomicrobia bacterium]|nr:DeoR/GlpR transcriptional regulator [Verrucomicrobiota bacterium]MCH8514153.1 DeoR/GlpR family DNA-binding transcription regulator [Kiritimatiellia bacterium]
MKTRSPAARHQRILLWLQEEEELRVRDLADRLGITSMTVWRDVKLLEEQGLLRKEHGVIRRPAAALRELDFESKDQTGLTAKRKIAELALRAFVREGDVIAMEGGTTVAALAELLPKQRVSVITNSLPIGLRLRQSHPEIPVRMIGGWISPVSGNCTGPDALREIRRHSATVCFLSATGWDAAKGPTDPNPLEIEVKRALAAMADRVVLLMDSRKFSVEAASLMIHPRRLHALVSEAPVPEAVGGMLEGCGVEVITE